MAVEVFFATNRNPNNEATPTDFGIHFSPKHFSDLRFGVAQVDGDRVSIQCAPEKIVNEKVLTDPNNILGSTKIFGDIKTKMKTERKDVLIMIHGYGTSFMAALKGAAKTQQVYAKAGKDMHVVMFSWPSDGKISSPKYYGNDRCDAEASGLAVARSMMKLIQFLHDLDEKSACHQKVHLLCHSMGNYVLRNALQQLLKMTKGVLPQVFDTILLMAADEDNDAFEHDHKLHRLPEMAVRVLVYFNNYDKALNISDWTKGNPARLGSDGPLHPRLIPAKVTLVDISEVNGFDPIGHGYYDSNKFVVADVAEVLKGTPAEKIPGRVYSPDKVRWMLVKR
jgi:esterase/lipase superfamily enzyme